LDYELWDIASGNCVGRYCSEVEALARARSLLVTLGSAYADDLEMIEVDEVGNFRGTSTGVGLIARVRDRVGLVETGCCQALSM
jgi:hypothetical protein